MSVQEKIDLLSLSDHMFERIVNQDIRNNENSEPEDRLDPETVAALRQPEIAERWYDTLLSFKRKVEAQFASHNAELTRIQAEYLAMGESGRVLWLKEKAEKDRWKKNTLWFKNGVEDRLAEARKLRASHRGSIFANAVLQERNSALKEAIRLRSAILDHRQDLEGEGEDVDHDLWSTIEGQPQIDQPA